MRAKRGARNGSEEGRGDGINRDKSVGREKVLPSMRRVGEPYPSREGINHQGINQEPFIFIPFLCLSLIAFDINPLNFRPNLSLSFFSTLSNGFENYNKSGDCN